MKIAQLTYSYKPITGGADAYADLLCSTLRERGHEVWVYQRPAEVDDPWVRTAPGALSRLRPRDFWLVPYWLRSRRRELEDLDVLIGHYPNYCASAYGHPQLIGLSHGVTWDDAPGSWRAKRKRAMARQAFERCARFVANDTFFLREMGLDVTAGECLFEEVAPGRWLIPNCVDTHHFQPSAVWAERTPTIVVPRNLYRNRGVHLAIRAFSQIGGGFGAYALQVVGADGQPDYAAEMRQLAVDLGIERRVTFRGSVPWREMPAIYRGAQLCLIPSVCGEGTSLAALEAMACGTATITTNAGGLTDLPAVHCEAEEGDLAQAMAEVLPRAEEIGGEQCGRVREHFAIERWRAAWVHVAEDW